LLGLSSQCCFKQRHYSSHPLLLLLLLLLECLCVLQQRSRTAAMQLQLLLLLLLRSILYAGGWAGCCSCNRCSRVNTIYCA
jgi:hypothetical protein